MHVDQLNRPIRMTNAAKASVWDATWLPRGGIHAITGTGTLNARFPGQWFELEAACWETTCWETTLRSTWPRFMLGPATMIGTRADHA